LGREAGRERERALPALDGRERVLERRTGRVARARVLVAAAQPADPVLLEGRDLVDRGDDCARRSVRVLARVDGAGREAGGGPVVGVVVRHPARLAALTDTGAPGQVGLTRRSDGGA